MPSLRNPLTQLCTQSQLEESFFPFYMAELNLFPAMNRKHWEYAYIIACMDNYKSGKTGFNCLGFGVGKEPIPAWIVAHGDRVVATDFSGAHPMWKATNQHASKVDDLPFQGICDKQLLEQNIQFRDVDMNNIPDDLRQREFDIVWSSCSLDHLGTLNHAKTFIVNSLDCLKPGGIAIHTTEFDLGPIGMNIKSGPMVSFQDIDFQEMSIFFANSGCTMLLDLTRGDGYWDKQVENPPYRNPHLVMNYSGHHLTSVGMWIRKGEK